MKSNISDHKQINYKELLFHIVEYYEAIKRNEEEFYEWIGVISRTYCKRKKQGVQKNSYISCVTCSEALR